MIIDENLDEHHKFINEIHKLQMIIYNQKLEQNQIKSSYNLLKKHHLQQLVSNHHHINTYSTVDNKDLFRAADRVIAIVETNIS